uniref:SFRICE_021589 n=1 Tax=Spodoptera frugiperda TaxID=7108 RepID=A0A2H1VK14_SPOFR
MSGPARKIAYQRHEYSGARKSSKRVKSAFRRMYGEDNRVKIWRAEELKKKLMKDQIIPDDDSIVIPSTSTVRQYSNTSTRDVDSQALIALVFERKPLWDKQNMFHNNRSVSDKYWKEICTELKQDVSLKLEKGWTDLTKFGLELSKHKVKKRWRYLRDYFTSELGKVESALSGDQGIEIIPKWPHYTSLLFLKDHVTPRSRLKPNGSSPSESMDQETEIIESESLDHDYCPSPVAQAFEDSSCVEQCTPKVSEMDVEHRILSYLQDKERSRQNRTDAQKEHVLFFKSLLPHVDKIPRHRLLAFRNRIQSVVEEFAYESLQNNGDIEIKISRLD